MSDWNSTANVGTPNNQSAYDPTKQPPEEATPVDSGGSASTSAHGNIVEDKDPLSNVPPRVTQQQIQPTAIANKFLSNLMTFSDLVAIPFVALNGQSTIATATLTNNNKQPIFAIPEISVYIGISNISQISNLTEWPTAAVGGGNFPIYFNPFDYGHSDGANQVARVTCRNNSGADQPCLFVVQWRVLTFPVAGSNISTNT